MKIQEKARKYSSMFEIGKRNDGKSFVKIKDSYTDNEPKELMESVRAAHGDRSPNDWVYTTYSELMDKVAEWDFASVEALEDTRHEIVDGYVDIYTADLTAWLAEDINNVWYLTETLEEFQPKDGFQLLSMAQYRAIDEVMQEVVNLLSQN
jgi:hypothetical protein